MSHRITRRKFIQAAAAGGSILFLPHLGRGAATTQANDRLNVANIGVGNQGGSHLGAAAGQNLVAICDTNEETLGAVARRFPKAKPYTDYRKMLDEMKEIDAVMVATADHSHFPACAMAMLMGKHAFCEKPLTHSIWEARQLARIAREKKLATQMGNQGHSGEGNRRLCEFIWAGAIGKVTEVHAWTNRPIWPQGMAARPKEEPVPKELHWDEWLGPAPQRPHGKGYQPFVWRGWLDFGTGALGDMGCHIMDGAVWALKLAEAEKVTLRAESSGLTAESYPNWSIITLEFSARGDMPPCKLVWYDGGKKPPRPAELEEEFKLGAGGSYFVGEKGTILSEGDYGGCRLIPETRRKEYKAPDKTIPRSKGMHADWIVACKGGPPASSNFVDSAAGLTEVVLLGNLAVRAGKPVEYDMKNMKITNLPDGEKLLKREARKGWDFVKG